MEYDYTPPSGLVDDLPQYLASELEKIAKSMNERPKYTDAHFMDKDSFINGRGKSEGVSVWDSTTKKPVWPQGDSDTAVWIFGDGTVAYSPK